MKQNEVVVDEVIFNVDVRRRRISIILVCMTAFLDMLGISMGSVIGPSLIREVQAEPKSCCPVRASECKPATIYHPDRKPSVDYYALDDASAPRSCTDKRRNRNSNLGLPTTVYGIGFFISAFWMPKFSDTYGRRPAFMLSLMGTTLGFLSFALSYNLWMMVIVRLAAGTLGGSVIANAYISDVYDKEEAHLVITRLSTLLMLSFVIGPMLAGGLVVLFDDIRAPLYVSGCVGCVCWVLAFFYITEPKDLLREHKMTANGDDNVSVSQKRNKPNPTRKLSSMESTYDEDYHPWFDLFNLSICLARFLSYISVTGLVMLEAVLLLESRYGVVDPDDNIDDQGKDIAVYIGYFASIVAVVSIPTMLFLFPVVVKLIGLLQTGILGCFLYGVLLFYIPYTMNLMMLLGCFVVVGIGIGLNNTVFLLSLSVRAPPDKVAETLALIQIVDSVAMFIGPFLVMLYRDGLKTPFLVAAIFEWVACLVLALILLNDYLKPKPLNEEQNLKPVEESANSLSSNDGDVESNIEIDNSHRMNQIHEFLSPKSQVITGIKSPANSQFHMGWASSLVPPMIELETEGALSSPLAQSVLELETFDVSSMSPLPAAIPETETEVSPPSPRPLSIPETEVSPPSPRPLSIPETETEVSPPSPRPLSIPETETEVSPPSPRPLSIPETETEVSAPSPRPLCIPETEVSPPSPRPLSIPDTEVSPPSPRPLSIPETETEVSAPSPRPLSIPGTETEVSPPSPRPLSIPETETEVSALSPLDQSVDIRGLSPSIDVVVDEED